MAVIEMAMPYHLERRRPASSYADYMLSPNLGRTIQSVRQAVLDGRKLIHALKNQGYEDISVLGMSLGSWVAGLIAAHDPIVRRAALLLSAGSLADIRDDRAVKTRAQGRPNSVSILATDHEPDRRSPPAPISRNTGCEPSPRRHFQDTIGRTGDGIVRQQLAVPPTLTIRPGFPVRVMVTRDLVLEPLGEVP